MGGLVSWLAARILAPRPQAIERTTPRRDRKGLVRWPPLWHLTDRYAGIDAATLDAIEKWTRGEGPADADEGTAQQVLREDGFLVHSRAEDDANVRAFLDRAADGIAGTMHVTLMPTLACNLACTYCFQKEHPAFTKMQERTERATPEVQRVDASGHALVPFQRGA